MACRFIIHLESWFIMKKIISIALVVIVLFSVFAVNIFANSSVEHNTNLLYLELNTIQPISKEQTRRIAELLDSFDVGKIIEFQVEQYYVRYSISFLDEHGSRYSIVMERTALIAILDENGYALWYLGGGQISSGWWQFWPAWLQCVLRVVFFGWIWMR